MLPNASAKSASSFEEWLPVDSKTGIGYSSTWTVFPALNSGATSCQCALHPAQASIYALGALVLPAQMERDQLARPGWPAGLTGKILGEVGILSCGRLQFRD